MWGWGWHRATLDSGTQQRPCCGGYFSGNQGPRARTARRARGGSGGRASSSLLAAAQCPPTRWGWAGARDSVPALTEVGEGRNDPTGDAFFPRRTGQGDARGVLGAGAGAVPPLCLCPLLARGHSFLQTPASGAYTENCFLFAITLL